MASKAKRRSTPASTSDHPSDHPSPPTSPHPSTQPPPSSSSSSTFPSSSSPSPPSSTPSSPPPISPFIQKLYSIVSNPSTQSIIHWADHGESFLVTNEYHFSSIVMKQHFRHSNFSSFVRQLNFYGFHSRHTPLIIHHQVHLTHSTALLPPARLSPPTALFVRPVCFCRGSPQGTPDYVAPLPLHPLSLTVPCCVVVCCAQRGTQGGATQFDHPHFKKGREDLLHLIVRKSGSSSSSAAASSASTSERHLAGLKADKGGEHYRDDIAQLSQQVRQLKQQYTDLAKMQQRILFVFGRYMSAGGGDTSRKRYVSGDEGDKPRQDGSSGSAKKQRLLIENRESSGDSQAEGARRGGGDGQRAFPNPLADIDWSEQHAMQDLIHSPYMRGAPQVLNTTPMPLELPPLQAGPMSRSVSASSQTRSPRPLLLTGGEEKQWREGREVREGRDGRRVTVPPIEVRRRQQVGQVRGVFYDAGDSPSSQSSTSTEAEHDRAGGLRVNVQPFVHPQPTSEHGWFDSAHLARNGVIYCPPAEREEVGRGVGWVGGDSGVKLEEAFEPVSPSPFGFPLPSTPPPLDPLSAMPPLQGLEQSFLPLSPSLGAVDGERPLSPFSFSQSALAPATFPPLSLTPTSLTPTTSPLPRYGALSQPVVTAAARSMAR